MTLCHHGLVQRLSNGCVSCSAHITFPLRVQDRVTGKIHSEDPRFNFRGLKRPPEMTLEMVLETESKISHGPGLRCPCVLSEFRCNSLKSFVSSLHGHHHLAKKILQDHLIKSSVDSLPESKGPACRPLFAEGCPPTPLKKWTL